MADDPKPKTDQFHGDDDAIRGGGATTDRGKRDSGQPGPSPEAAEREQQHPRSTAEDKAEGRE